MFSSGYLVALVALLANVPLARGAICVQNDDDYNVGTYNISSQADYDAIAQCELSFLRGTTEGRSPSYFEISGIKGSLNIDSSFIGVLDFGNASFVTGSVQAVNNLNMLGIEAQNLIAIGLRDPNINGLVLQNLPSFSYLNLPTLNLTDVITLSSLPKLRNFSLPALANYSNATTFLDTSDMTHYMSLTIDNTGIGLIEGVGIADMGVISITNNLELETVDLSTVNTLQSNLTFFNNGPSLSLNLTNLIQATAIQLTNVDSVDISNLQVVSLSTQITNNTFANINTSSLEDFGSAGLQVNDNANLKSLNMSNVVNTIAPTDSVLQIYDNPQLVLTDSSFSSLESIGNITINSTISGGDIFPSLSMILPNSIHITSINTPQSNTTFTCAYLDEFADHLWETVSYPKISESVYSCASYASATSTKDIAAHYVVKKKHTHLSHGADIGIAIAVVFVCAVLTAMCFVRRRKKLTPKPVVDEDGDELPSYQRHAEQPPAYRGADGAAGYFAGPTRVGAGEVPVPPYEEVGGGSGVVRSVDVGEVGDGGIEHEAGLEHGDEHGANGATATANADANSYRISEESERDADANSYRISEESERDRRSSVRGDGRVSMESTENDRLAMSRD